MMKFKKKCGNQKGFSLVEVLLAIVILALVATPILQLFTTSMKISKDSRELMGATDVAQATMEVLTSKPMEGTEGLDALLTDSTSHVIIGSLGFTTGCGAISYTGDFATFKTMLKDTYSAGVTEQCFYSKSSDALLVSFHGVEYNKQEYDVVVRMRSNGTGGDKYFTYDVDMEVYSVLNPGSGTEVHYNELLVVLEGAVANKSN